MKEFKFNIIGILIHPKQRWLIVISMMIFAACKQVPFDSEEALWAYIKAPDNGLQQQKTVRGVNYTLTYRPTDLLVKQEMEDEATQSTIDSLRHKFDDFLYFTLSMDTQGQELLTQKVGKRREFGALVNQLAFGMGSKIHLYSKTKDTIALTDYVYPRMYGMGKGTTMMLVYPRDEKLLLHPFFHLTIEDLGFKTGEVGFKIPTAPIKNEPRLSFKNRSNG